MKEFGWSELKSQRLKKTRGVSFDEILAARLVGIVRHPRREYQNMMLFELKGYIWAVPYVENKDTIFLKTLYPSRKYTKQYRRGNK